MIVIIMAAGMGKRMESNLPKVLHKVTHPLNHNIEYPMLIHVIMTSMNLNPNKIFIIVGKFREIISNEINKYESQGLIPKSELIEYIDQEIALGTGHAIKCSLDQISSYHNEKALILSGDVPLITIDTLDNLLFGNTNKILITELSNPFGCGRILFDTSGRIIGIREEKDCNDDEKNINLVNCGIYQIMVKDLVNLIPQISNNNKSQEYYLTDIVDLMIKNNIELQTCILDKKSQWEIKNVNTKKDLEELNNFVKNNL
jgi:bifunctional N-acetylglucosamine-1-phosphate-uridyltransferase/glucosamine-1-phosphate-acetyltransferase GlmU-like protein